MPFMPFQTKDELCRLKKNRLLHTSSPLSGAGEEPQMAGVAGLYPGCLGGRLPESRHRGGPARIQHSFPVPARNYCVRDSRTSCRVKKEPHCGRLRHRHGLGFPFDCFALQFRRGIRTNYGLDFTNGEALNGKIANGLRLDSGKPFEGWVAASGLCLFPPNTEIQ